MDLKIWKEKAVREKKSNKKFFSKLKQRTPKDLDVVVSGYHDDVFEEIDCLTCANCCKTTSPIFIDKDIDRISKYLRMKPGQFINQYLKLDEENDYVLQQSPCSFLMDDNCCSIYEVRPRACKDYPHTNRKKFIQISSLTIKNTEICPAVVKIVDSLKKHYS